MIFHFMKLVLLKIIVRIRPFLAILNLNCDVNKRGIIGHMDQIIKLNCMPDQEGKGKYMNECNYLWLHFEKSLCKIRHNPSDTILSLFPYIWSVFYGDCFWGFGGFLMIFHQIHGICMPYSKTWYLPW